MESPLITLDTSALFALLNRRDPAHVQVRDVLLAQRQPYLVPAGVLAEIGYLVEHRLGLDALEAFLADLEEHAFALVLGDEDLPRIRTLVRRYGDLPLGLAGAIVIACAERHGGRVLTLDARHFAVGAREGTITPLPA